MPLVDGAVKAITTSRVGLLFERPFFGNLAIRLYLQERNDLPFVFNSDGHTVFYNRAYVLSLTPKQLTYRITAQLLQDIVMVLAPSNRGSVCDVPMFENYPSYDHAYADEFKSAIISAAIASQGKPGTPRFVHSWICTNAVRSKQQR